MSGPRIESLEHSRGLRESVPPLFPVRPPIPSLIQHETHSDAVPTDLPRVPPCRFVAQPSRSVEFSGALRRLTRQSGAFRAERFPAPCSPEARNDPLGTQEETLLRAVGCAKGQESSRGQR